MSIIDGNIILSLGKALSRQSNFKTILDYLITELVKNIPSPGAGAIFIYNRNHHQLVAEASHGYSASIDGYSLNIGEGLPGHCLSQRKSFLIDSC